MTCLTCGFDHDTRAWGDPCPRCVAAENTVILQRPGQAPITLADYVQGCVQQAVDRVREEMRNAIDCKMETHETYKH